MKKTLTKNNGVCHVFHNYRLLFTHHKHMLTYDVCPSIHLIGIRSSISEIKSREKCFSKIYKINPKNLSLYLNIRIITMYSRTHVIRTLRGPRNFFELHDFSNYRILALFLMKVMKKVVYDSR